MRDVFGISSLLWHRYEYEHSITGIQGKCIGSKEP